MKVARLPPAGFRKVGSTLVKKPEPLKLVEKPPTADEIAVIVLARLPAPVVGENGRDAEPVSDAQITEAVTAYLRTHPVQKAKDGDAGKPGRDASIPDLKKLLRETVLLCKEELRGPRGYGSAGYPGRDGPPGPIGPAGPQGAGPGLSQSAVLDLICDGPL